jgi:calcineurin-like phosphoesterase family protein
MPIDQHSTMDPAVGNAVTTGRPVVRRLLCALAFCLVAAAQAQAAPQLQTIVADVPGSSGYRYGVHDSAGNSMDGLKIVKSPLGGYVGVYHTLAAGRYAVKVASSSDLLTWQFAANLVANGSQATIYRLAQGASLVAYESHVNCGGAGHCLALRYYQTETALRSGAASRSLILPRTLSTCAEGTPNIFSATSDLSLIDLGFHYLQGCNVERQARGTLRNFDRTTWVPSATAGIDSAILAAGASANGNIGDRDGNLYDGAYRRLYEAQLVNLASWRTFLMTGGTVMRLTMRTHGGSKGFTNPTFTPVTLPSGKPGVVVTQYVTPVGAAAGEVGELVYYRDLESDPTIAAAGDISCAQVTCHDDETSNMIVANAPDKVLTLGDNQYERGELLNYQTYYEPDWGRLKSITMPAPGNHDTPSSGYTAYFGVPANYSYDLGKWHVISLDSTGIAAATTFLDADLAQHPSRCILAYWHHPRFSSGGVHGNNSALAPLWDRLYAAGADVILNGHDHDYERFAPQNPAGVADPAGIRELVVGTGGKTLYSFGTLRANSEFRLSKYGILRMTLHPTSYEWRFQGEDGVVYDMGSGDCT